MYCARYFGHILMKLEFARQFQENRSSWIRIVPYGQTGRNDEVNNHFLQFCERA